GVGGDGETRSRDRPEIRAGHGGGWVKAWTTGGLKTYYLARGSDTVKLSINVSGHFSSRDRRLPRFVCRSAHRRRRKTSPRLERPRRLQYPPRAPRRLRF